MVRGDPCTEGSGTAKSGTDEQKRHKRLFGEGKQAHHCNAHITNFQIVDVAGIGGKNMLLPRKKAGQALGRSRIRLGFLNVEKSAEVIVVDGKRAVTKYRGLTRQRRTEH